MSTLVSLKKKILPPDIMALGLCTVLGATGKVAPALILGLVLIAVILIDTLVVKAVSSWLSKNALIAAAVIVSAASVTVLSMFLELFAPDVVNELGIFLPLLAVNAVVLTRACAAADKTLALSLSENLMGGGLFLAVLVGLSLIREILGQGKITLFPIGEWNGIITIPVLAGAPIKFFASPAGALVLGGLLFALYSFWMNRPHKEVEA